MSMTVQNRPPQTDEAWCVGVVYGHKDDVLLDLYKCLSVLAEANALDRSEQKAWVAVNLRMEYLTGNFSAKHESEFSMALRAALNGWGLESLESLRSV
jgi:hypothetical protein